MTGFGRGEYTKDGRKFTVEIKTVNHRYLDFNIKMPKKFNFLELFIKNKLKSNLQRGKVDIYISYEDTSEESNSVKVNTPLVKDYLGKLSSLCDEYGITNDMTISCLARLPEVIKLEEQQLDEELVWNNLSCGLEDAVTQLIDMRKQEGALIYEDLVKKLDYLTTLMDKLTTRAPMVVQEYKEKLNNRLEEMLDDDAVDTNRIAQEVALFADKCGIDEELVRLRSHICQMRDTLDATMSVGRKLDFLAQEMNREANTIASKSNDVHITKLAIDLKTEIEKIREQIQNVE